MFSSTNNIVSILTSTAVNVWHLCSCSTYVFLEKLVYFLSDANPLGALPNDSCFRLGPTSCGQPRRPAPVRAGDRRIRVQQVVPVGPETWSFDPRSSGKPLGLEFGGFGSNFAGFQPEVFVADAVLGSFELLLADRVSEESADGLVADLLRRDGRGGRVRREEFKFWRQKFELRAFEFAVPAEAAAAAQGAPIVLWKVSNLLKVPSLALK